MVTLTNMWEEYVCNTCFCALWGFSAQGQYTCKCE